MKNAIKISITTIGILTMLRTSTLAITGIVNASSGLVLREQASKTGNPITTVPDKTEVEIIEQNGEWYKVTYNLQEGYLFSEYVNKSETEELENKNVLNAEISENNANNIQIMNNLKVYNIPLITSTVVGEIEVNTEITIIKQITNWSYVSSEKIQGWVRTYGIQNINKNNEEIIEQPETVKPEETEPTVSQPEQSTVENPEIITQPSNTSQTETASTATKGFVAVSSATVRSKATKDSEIVTYLIKDTSFIITAETEEWYKIKYVGIDDTIYEGYIYKQLVTI